MGISKKKTDDETKIKEIIRKPYFVPETKRNFEIFNEMRLSGDKIAIIIDEYGGLSGVMTLKKLLEEVVGDFGEEGTKPEEELIEIDTNTFNIDGGMSIQDLNEEFEDIDINIPDGDYETVAGFILQKIGKMPQAGDHFEYSNLFFEVLEMKGLKLETVKVTKKSQSAIYPNQKTNP